MNESLLDTSARNVEFSESGNTSDLNNREINSLVEDWNYDNLVADRQGIIALIEPTFTAGFFRNIA